jgi:hypothetical protein
VRQPPERDRRVGRYELHVYPTGTTTEPSSRYPSGGGLWRVIGAEYQPHVVAIDAEARIVARLQGLGNEAGWEALAAKLR